QVLMGRGDSWDAETYERTLYIARKEIERIILDEQIQDVYIPSFSHRYIVYKGLLNSPQLNIFYKDLKNGDYDTALCVYHQRYSTNTFPTWPLAQPFRMLGHNGEINTINGNRFWMKARTKEFKSELFGEDVKWLDPVIQPGGSDSCSLDNALELLVNSGRPILHAILMLVPSAWRTEPRTGEDVRAFYEYHASMMEPWDGPAALTFSDGVIVGACLDRNGLRPARYKITSDGFFIMGSENGTIKVADDKVVEKGRLGPGQIIAVDTASGKLLRNDEIKRAYAVRKPFAQWIKENLWRLSEHAPASPKPPADMDAVDLVLQQLTFGYTAEEVNLILKPMLETGKESVGSMGDDTPLSVLSHQPRLLYSYFKQLFAQVTNPPIDPIREELVMSLNSLLGHQRNLLEETPEHARRVQISHPILSDEELKLIENPAPHFTSVRLSCLFPKSEGEDGLAHAIVRLEREAAAAVDAGHYTIILSDRGVNAQMVPIPMLLATGAVHHALIRIGKRLPVSVVCETAEARDVHQMACLLGYGAAAINPWLALQTLREFVESDENQNGPKLTWEKALKNYRKGLGDGILKIMSKMGISTLGSYKGAQIFECIGVHPDVCERHFTGTPSRVGGIGLKEIAREALLRHEMGYGLADQQTAPPAGAAAGEAKRTLKDPGYYRFRREGERHAYTPNVIMSFHKFVKTGTPEEYKKYVASVEDSNPIALRHLLQFKKTNPAVPLEEVEPIEEITRRFTTAGMSLGALSPEAHECLAIAMNRIGGRSNSGEGGEDNARFHVRPNGDNANSAIKQVASGRFGVTAEYLASAKEIEIKMAQGSKPGEGGQLPGKKNNRLIARLRH
ncbi:MAG: glutamate synthase subunit alpha, partial [Verrucomicrobiae bacterium]|nr:glutamate synthase subunit alpha [Verrucomicrobiae bacterium]